MRSFQGAIQDNPAVRLVDFLEDHFTRISCSGLLIETAKAYAVSPTLASVGPVRLDTVRKYVEYW